MALSTESILNVKRKVLNYLNSGTKGDPFAAAQFEALFRYLAQHGANPDLQFVPFSNLGADAVVADAACKVYGIYLKKQNTATDAFYKIFDDAATDSSAEDAILAIGLLLGRQREVKINPDGTPLAAGLVHGSYTAIAGAAGTTASTSGDGPDGFVIFGAP
jgi:hypothetical protein